VVGARLISADGDLDPAAVAGLAAKYHASVGDWESGAIAWVASHNHAPVIILRGVTDVIDAAGNDPTYHAPGAWERASVAVMTSLVALLGDALRGVVRSLARARRGAPPASATEAGDDVGRCLNQLDQHAFAGARRGVVAARVDETDIVAGGAATDAARREPHALRGEPGHGR